MCDFLLDIDAQQYKHDVKQAYMFKLELLNLKHPRCVFTSKVFQSTAAGAAAPSAGCHKKQRPADLWTNRNAEWERPACKHMYTVSIFNFVLMNC